MLFKSGQKTVEGYVLTDDPIELPGHRQSKRLVFVPSMASSRRIYFSSLYDDPTTHWYPILFQDKPPHLGYVGEKIDSDTFPQLDLRFGYVADFEVI